MQSLEREYLVNEVDGFSLVGIKSSHYWCGVWQTYGCLNHKTAYVRQFKRTCFRSECKVCYISWARRQANRAVTKLNRMKKNNTLHHTVITLNKIWCKDTKKHLVTSLKNAGVESACILFTPFDESNDRRFFLKSVVHVFYYGKLRYSGALQVYTQDDLDGSNQKLFKVLQQQFLNCGIKKGTHPVTWIGKTLYCTLESQISSSDGRNCPLCNKKLHLIYFDGDIPPIPPDESFSGELEKEGWEYCFSESIWNKIKRKALRFIKLVYKCILCVSILK